MIPCATSGISAFTSPARPAEVYAFASAPGNLPHWAAGLARSKVRWEGDERVVHAPFGKVRVVLRPLSGPMLYRARQEYAAREVVKFPRYFIIEPTALCNRRCPFCSILVTNRGGMMTWRHFVKLMEECGKHEVYGLSLYQLGEPLLWRGDDPFGARLRITDMVNTAKSLGGFCVEHLNKR